MLYFFRILGKMSQNLLSAAVVIGALRVKKYFNVNRKTLDSPPCCVYSLVLGKIEIDKT